MNGFVLLDTLIWVGGTGLLMTCLVLAACRSKLLHPAVKTWLCRIIFLKVSVSLVLGSSLPLVRDQAWLTAELMWFLMAVWATGVVIVATHACRAYLAAAHLKSRATPSRIGRPTADLEVRELAGLPEPCIVGVFKPVLLVPAAYHADPAVIQHELAHIKHFDAPFGALAWLVQAVFWFVPGCGKLIAEHSLWQEVWADLASRQRLELEPGFQAKALLSAVSRIRETPAVALGYRGDAKVVARRIEAMFIGRYSRVFGLLVLMAACVAAIPLELNGSGRPAQEILGVSSAGEEDRGYPPVATIQNVP